MTVSEKDVARVAELANLELTDNEKSRMLHDLNSILDYVAQLNELDTTRVEPMTQAGVHWKDSQRADAPPRELRPDVVLPSLSRQEVLRCAPETDGIFFKVPKVIDR